MYQFGGCIGPILGGKRYHPPQREVPLVGAFGPDDRDEEVVPKRFALCPIVFFVSLFVLRFDEHDLFEAFHKHVVGAFSTVSNRADATLYE